MKVNIGDVRIELGKGISSGIVCILVGALLLVLARSTFTGGTPDTGLLSPVTTVLAQTHPGSAELDPGHWAYLGAEDNPDDWSFSTLILVPDRRIEILRAKTPVKLYEDHYGDWTGSLVGALIGSPVPEVRGELDAGQCVYVRSREVVGLGRIWLNVEPLECEPVQEILDREALVALAPQ